MKKQLIYIALMGCVVWLNSCGTVPSEPRVLGLRLTYTVKSGPVNPSIFYPRPQRLGKGAGKHKNMVLCLPCDETDGNTAWDCSPFNNNVQLFNVDFVSFDHKRALGFSGTGSFGFLEHSSELNGTFGLDLSLQIHVDELDGRREQIIIDKLGLYGGYALGISDDRLFFRVGALGDFQQITSVTNLSTGVWYDIRAGFEPDSLYLNIAGQSQKQWVGIDSLGPSYQRLYFGADGESVNNFKGAVDEIYLWTTQDYVELDRINVLVYDFSMYSNPDSLYTSPVWHAYADARHRILEEEQWMSWNERKKLWNAYFSVIDDQMLTVKNGMISGSVAGVVGLNLVVVGASYRGELVYEGQATVMGRKDASATAEITMWPAQGHYRDGP